MLLRVMENVLCVYWVDICFVCFVRLDFFLPSNYLEFLFIFLFAFLSNFILVTAQGSQTLTQNGSSFESASSIYSLARVENICEDAPTTTIEDTLSLPPSSAVKPSPSHSISSSSSGSYFNGKKAVKSTSPRGSIVVQQPSTSAAASIPNTESISISDDEKSEKRYSSSGYYESPHDDGEWRECASKQCCTIVYFVLDFR